MAMKLKDLVDNPNLLKELRARMSPLISKDGMFERDLCGNWEPRDEIYAAMSDEIEEHPIGGGTRRFY